MFEFFFKYPRSVYTRGQFALLGAWPKWMLVVLILAAAAGLAWLIRSRLAQAAPVIRGWRAWVIWGLQTLLAALEIEIVVHLRNGGFVREAVSKSKCLSKNKLNRLSHL